MEYTAATNDAGRAEKSDLLVHAIVLAVSSIISLYVAQISNMSMFIIRAGMSVLIRVVMGPGCETSIRQVTVLMHMEAVKLSRIQSLEGSLDVGPREGILLFKEHNALSCLVWLRIHDADGTSCFDRSPIHAANLSAKHGAL